MRAYVGLIQRPGATGIGDGWFWVTGEVTPPIWNPNEPTDGDALTETGAEQFTTLERTYFGLIDIPGTIVYPALCECDGNPITTEATMAVDAYRM